MENTITYKDFSKIQQPDLKSSITMFTNWNENPLFPKQFGNGFFIQGLDKRYFSAYYQVMNSTEKPSIFISNYDSVTNKFEWHKLITDIDVKQSGKFNHINIDNEYLSAYLVWYTHLNICHVALNNITVKRTYDPIIIYDQLPKSQMDSHIDIFNKGNGSWFGSGWMDKGTSTLFCRLCRLDNGGWISFSYPIDFS